MTRKGSYTLIATYQIHIDYDVMTLRVRSKKGNETLICSLPIDRNQIKEWVSNLLKHIEDEFPFRIKETESLFDAIYRLYDELDPETDEDGFEKLYRYRCIHDLSFGNRGVEMPSIIIGNRNGRLTISKDHLNFEIEDLNCLVR